MEKYKKLNTFLKINSIVYLNSLFFLSISLYTGIISVQNGIIPYIFGIYLLMISYMFLWKLPHSYFSKYFYQFLGFGIILRILLSFSYPLWEDDWARYLWEGYLIRSGISPYTNPPELFFSKILTPDMDDRVFEILSRINHPEYTAIYSPFVLLTFFISSTLFPLSLTAIKLGYIGFDLGIFLGIYQLKNKKSAILYFFFPILLKEVYINSHFELLPMFFCMAAIYSLRKYHPHRASFFYGLAVHTKLYLIWIFPFFFISSILYYIYNQKSTYIKINKKYSNKKFFQIQMGSINFQSSEEIKSLFYGIIPGVITFLLGFTLPIGVLQYFVGNNLYFGFDTLLGFANEFTFNPQFFLLIRIFFGSSLGRILVGFTLFFYLLYSVYHYRKFFINIQDGIQWSLYVFLITLLFSPIVNAWYFLLPSIFFFLTRNQNLWILILLSIPQISYLTDTNLHPNGSSYYSFYYINDFILYFELICNTIIFIFLYLNRSTKKKLTKENI